MNYRLSIVLLILGISALVVNHLVVDWKSYEYKKGRLSLESIVQSQALDLSAWSSGEEHSSDFRKRSICQGRLAEWSDNKPFVSSLSSDSLQVVENDLGVWLIQQQVQRGCVNVSVHQLSTTFSITNQYLRSGISERLYSGIKSVRIQEGLFSGIDKVTFEVDGMPSRVIDSTFMSVLIVVLISFYWKGAGEDKKSFWLWTVGLVLVRILTLLFDTLEIIFRNDLFDPVEYTSSFVNPTLGDLFLNCVFLLIILIRGATFIKRSSKSKSGVVMISAFSTLLSGLVLHVAWTIISHSQLSLDVGQSIRFDLLRSVAYITIVLVTISYFYFTYLALSIFRRSRRITEVVTGAMLAATLMGVLDTLSITCTVVHISILLLALRNNWGTSFKDFSYSNLLYILCVSVGISAVLSFCIYKYEEGATLDSKRKFANYLLLKRDVLGEFYLNQTISKLSNDENLELIASERSRNVLEAQIKSEFLTPYFNKYDLEIVFQDYQQLRLNTRFTRENSLLTPESQSDYENIYFIDEGTSYKYVCKVNIGDLVGLIILKIKKRVPTSVYPALLTDNKYFDMTNSFDYAVFSGDDILFHRSKFGQGEWPQANDFLNERLYSQGIEKNNRHYYGVKTTDGRTILIISDKYDVRDRLANFSFFFLVLLFSLGFFSASSSVMDSGLRLNFTGKIQLYLGLAFVFPLMVAGFALLNTLNTSYREEINRSYIKQSLYISEMLSGQIEQVNSENGVEILAEISSFIQSDLSFYNESGYLVATSQPEIFNLDLLGNLVNPVVFDELVEKENQSIIAEESVGNLDYKVCYAVVNTIDNQIAGFIAMPFFDSRNHLQRQQIEVFGNLISIFGIIFALAIIFGHAVLNNLMHPLRMVAAKIRRTTLQDVNQPITYESKDEIGSLVKDYNQMLVKLEESKTALAKSQKVAAWKEIAKQVAHEIKNPLTPMQLKIQQMLRKHEPESKEHETLSSLLKQVDTLSQIAQSFSAFADMPAPDNQVFDWGSLVKEVVGLYGAEDVETILTIENGVLIDADKDIFRRILNNIVLNAIQSVENKEAQIQVTLVKRGNKAILSIQDNGRGISEELKDKIFLKYFSTKSTGSGIGLALAKKGIENAGGNIWFESEEDAGTTFFISMPLADM